MLDDTMLDGVAQFVEPPFVLIKILANISIKLIACAWDNYIVFGPADAEL